MPHIEIEQMIVPDAQAGLSNKRTADTKVYEIAMEGVENVDSRDNEGKIFYFIPTL